MYVLHWCDKFFAVKILLTENYRINVTPLIKEIAVPTKVSKNEKFKWSLSRKGLAFITATLLVQLFFFGWLALLLQQSEYVAQKEYHGKEVFGRANWLAALLSINALSGAGYAISADPDCNNLYQWSKQRVPAVLNELAATLSEQDQVQRDQIKSTRAAWSLMTKVISDQLTRKPESASESLTRLKADEQTLKPVWLELIKARHLAMLEERTRVDTSQESPASVRESLKMILYVGMALSILTAISSFYLFSKRITTRIDFLSDNANRLARGETLSPPIPGGDEIADLDKTFHSMAEELNAAKLRLESSERRMVTLIENMPVGLLTVDKNSNIDFANPVCKKMFLETNLIGTPLTALLQLKPGELEILLGQKSSISSPPASSKQSGSSEHSEPSEHSGPSESESSKHSEPNSESKSSVPSSTNSRTAESVHDNDNGNGNEQSDSDQPIETTLMRANASPIIVELTSKFVTMAEGERTLIMLQDVTQRHELERLKQEFLAMVSHDLRTPLSSIDLFLHLTKKLALESLPTQVKNNLLIAERSTKRLLNLVNDLLDIEQLQTGKMALNRRWTNFSDVVENSIAAVKNVADQRHIKIATDISAIELDCDEERVVQVIVNLLSNAIKFSPDESNVTVSAKSDGPWILCKVIDNGRGIPESYVHKIFEKYKQVQKADGKRGAGTGLGLPICKAIIEQHGGTIGVESVAGKGSTFWFKLPTEKSGDIG
ncbi:MAG TPA: ATP-binding protein [Drouetiella sp.]|jgi:signal transduction histidine kinase/PAS domain-containing protein